MLHLRTAYREAGVVLLAGVAAVFMVITTTTRNPWMWSGFVRRAIETVMLLIKILLAMRYAFMAWV